MLDEEESRETVAARFKIGLTRKKKTYGYKESNEEKHAEFLKIIATKEPQNLVYIDESGHRTMDIARKDSGFVL